MYDKFVCVGPGPVLSRVGTSIYDFFFVLGSFEKTTQRSLSNEYAQVKLGLAGCSGPGTGKVFRKQAS